MRPMSKIAKDFWDYTTLDPKILADAARLTPKDLVQLSRPGFTVQHIRHAGIVLHRGSAGVRLGLAEVHRGGTGRHLRSHRSHGAAAPGGADRERPADRRAGRATSGPWTSGTSTAARRRSRIP